METKLLLTLVCLVGGGCQSGRVGGISLSVGSYERGLWFDHDARSCQSKGWGMKLDFVVGQMIRPVPKFWMANQNVWKGDGPWFVLRLPMIGPFISLSLGKIGVYLGFKTFEVRDEHRVMERYGRWIKEKEFPSEKDGTMVYLQPSVSLRRTRWK